LLLSTKFGDINNPLTETIFPTFFQGDLYRELTSFRQVSLLKSNQYDDNY